MKKALLIVDVQNDFCPGGALGIKDGDKIIPAINKYLKIFASKELPIFASRDWHPKVTRHFRKFGGAWPVHCIQDTKGAAFHPKLKLPKRAILLYKGMNPKEDSYSAFQAQDRNGISLFNLLKMLAVKEIYIGGLATDYCVRFTTEDAIREGFKVNVLLDAIKGVNLKPNDSQDAIKEMVSIGAKEITLKEISKADEKKP